MNQALKLSIIIPNFNYEDFVAAAIDSALALDWPHTEVIVVDDGSTDRSREVMARYADRVQIIHQDNAGQLHACNAGFAKATGDLVMFLDSDDMVAPSLMHKVSAVWHKGVSKVQVQMFLVDAAGKPTGGYLPQYHGTPTPKQITRWASTAMSYPTPPGSGNLYARAFLNKIFPLTEVCGNMSDSCCLAASPHVGEVLTVPEPLVAYRVHGKNAGAVTTLNAAQLIRQLVKTRQRFDYARDIARQYGGHVADDALNRSLNYLPYRLGSLIIAGDAHPIAGDSRGAVLLDMLKASLTPQGRAWTGRLSFVVWGLLVCASSRTFAERIILWRFAPSARPRFLTGALKSLKVIRGA